MKYSAEMPDPGLFADEGATVKVTEDRRLRTADLRAATHYVPVFAQESDGFFPGTTAIGTSTAILQELNTKGETSAAFTFDTTEDGAIRASRNMDSNVYDSSIKAQLKRMGAVKVPVLVNDRRVTLNAVRVRATLDGESQPSEFVFLDDEANPLTLSFRIARTSNAAPGIPGMAETCADMRKLGMPVDEEMCAAAISGAAQQVAPRGSEPARKPAR
jgi:hypothetical protein